MLWGSYLWPFHFCISVVYILLPSYLRIHFRILYSASLNLIFENFSLVFCICDPHIFLVFSYLRGWNCAVRLIFVAISFLYFCSLHFATLIFENSFQDSVFCISESYIWELFFSILHLWSSYHFSIFTFARLELCFVDFSRQFQTTQDANRLQT